MGVIYSNIDVSKGSKGELGLLQKRVVPATAGVAKGCKCVNVGTTRALSEKGKPADYQMSAHSCRCCKTSTKIKTTN